MGRTQVEIQVRPEVERTQVEIQDYSSSSSCAAASAWILSAIIFGTVS